MSENSQEPAWLSNVQWEIIDPPVQSERNDSVPHATHRGVVELGPFRLRVYQLSNGMRLIDAEDLAKLFAANPAR
jgi:hypothetical protein